MATSRAKRPAYLTQRNSPIGKPVDEARLQKLRTNLEQGMSLNEATRRAGLSVNSGRKYRNDWLDDGSLVIPPERVRIPSKGAVAEPPAVPTPLPAEPTPSTPTGGEVGATADTVDGAQQPPRDPEPGDVAQSPGEGDGNSGPYGRLLDLPPGDFELEVDEYGELVVNVRMQVPIAHVQTYQQMMRLGLISPELSLNAWTFGMVDDHIASCMGLGLALVRIPTPEGATDGERASA